MPKVLGLVPDPAGSVPGAVHVLAFRRPAGAASAFARTEDVLPPPAAGALVERVFGADPPAAAASAPGAVRDLFVCTHGSRDRCCARFGYPLYVALRALRPPAAAPFRVWRTSHTGGHRFAPTMVELPAGRYWGHLDLPEAEAVAGRAEPAAALAPCLRGRALVPPLAQPVEAELFALHGWAWDGAALSADVEPLERDGRGVVRAALVRLRLRRPGAPAAVAVASVVADGTVPTGGCGKPAGEEPAYRVADVRLEAAS